MRSQKCDHFQSLKPQKLANFIKKSAFKCSVSKHTDTQFNLCLHCGEVRCNSNQNSCSKSHSQASKHGLVLKLLACYLYCNLCQVQIQGMIQDAEEYEREEEENGRGKRRNKGGAGDRVEKMRELFNKIREMAIKNLPTIYTDKKVQKQKQNKTPIINITTNPKKHKDSSSSQQQQQPTIQLRTFGLANIGNTCYFNSVLQCLYSTPQLHSFYRSHQSKDDLNITFRKFLTNSQKVFNPKSLFGLLSKGFKFLKSMDQQDAYQLYVLLIDSLIESSARKNQSHQDKIDNSVGKVFGFTCASRLQCLKCDHVSWNKDFNLGLTVSLSKSSSSNNPSHKFIQIPQNQQIPFSQIGQQNLRYPSTLSHLQSPNANFLDIYFSPEPLSKSNSFKCEQCSQSSAIHKFYIKSAPQILVINFKRFSNTGVKINTHVNIPQEVVLDQHCLRSGRYRYQIYAGVVHHGSARGGHYIAYTRRGRNWYYFSDSHVKMASFNSLKQANPYVIFYRRIANRGQEDHIKKQKQKQKQCGVDDAEQLSKQKPTIDFNEQKSQDSQNSQAKTQQISSSIAQNTL